MNDTIFALSSGRPPAAVAIIRVSGPAAHEAAERLAGSLPPVRSAALRELRHPRSGELIDESLVLRFDSPASSTGEDVMEFQCHGGRAVIDALLSALASIEGLRQAQPGEFTRRAFDNGRIDLTEAEGLADLIEAETEAQRKSALALAEGGLRQQIERWRERLVELSASAERAIDYDDDDLAPDPVLFRESNELLGDLREWLARPRVEALKDGVRIVVAGPPNAGKSSIVNAIAGSERAIVSEIPGTTRDHIEVPLAVAGTPLLLIDTAGIRETHDPVESIGVARAVSLLAAADVVLWLGDEQEPPEHPRVIRVHAQVDRPERQEVPSGAYGVSSVTGAGMMALLERIVSLAKAVLPAEGAMALNRRQAELIGEAAAALEQAQATELVILAESYRRARLAFDQLTGRAGVEDVLDSIFSRFCLGK